MAESGDGCLFAAAVIVTQQVLKVQRRSASRKAGVGDESERIFRAVLPGKQRIPTVSHSVERDEAKYGGSGDGDLIGWPALPLQKPERAQ